MQVLKRFLLPLLLVLSFGLSIFISYMVSYSLLSKNVAPLSIPVESIRTLDSTVKYISLVSNVLKEHFSTLKKGSKFLDSKRISEHRILIYQLSRDYVKEIESFNNEGVCKYIDEVADEFVRLLDRMDTMMKFPTDISLASEVCRDLRNLLKKIKSLSKAYKLQCDVYIDRLVEEFEGMCKF
ncbi:MAG: hypothetical protein N3G21_07180 [Candidatus Hydrogenedentes bacterium]|nr:hypothetical protein [Candidatus Hydrogenedentota bacterium]